MSIDAARPDVARVMGTLKDFQRASAEYVFRRLYLDEKPARRFLIADEVGLGKTLVAKGVVAKAIDHLWESVERIDVLYICSNAEIARQNIRKLNPTDRTDFALASRITLLPITVQTLKQNKVNFISFTPGTSLDLKSSLGMRDERLLLLALLERGWGVEGSGVENLLAGHVQIDRFRRKRREFEDEYGPKIDATLSKQFFDLLAQRAKEDAAAGREDMRSRLDRIAPAYARGKRCVEDSVWWEGMRWVGDLRTTLAEACLDALQPDLVVLDEFQRFKGLLDGTDPASELASKIFSYRDVRVLLLSATPYKMYTTSSEADGEDHYRDFLETLGFLFDDTERRRRVEAMVDEYRRSLLAVADAGTERLERARDALEGELRSVMVRTERLANSGDRNGMLRQPQPVGVTLEAADVRSYLTLQRVARILDQPDVIEFWKSAPYALNRRARIRFGLRSTRRSGRSFSRRRRSAKRASTSTRTAMPSSTGTCRRTPWISSSVRDGSTVSRDTRCARTWRRATQRRFRAPPSETRGRRCSRRPRTPGHRRPPRWNLSGSSVDATKSSGMSRTFR